VAERAHHRAITQSASSGRGRRAYWDVEQHMVALLAPYRYHIAPRISMEAGPCDCATPIFLYEYFSKIRLLQVDNKTQVLAARLSGDGLNSNTAFVAWNHLADVHHDALVDHSWLPQTVGRFQACVLASRWGDLPCPDRLRWSSSTEQAVPLAPRSRGVAIPTGPTPGRSPQWCSSRVPDLDCDLFVWVQI